MISLLFVTFGVVFFGLATYHYIESREVTEPFKIKAEFKSSNGSSTGVVEFIGDFNDYLLKTNKKHKDANTMASMGYVVAGILECVSAYMMYIK